MTTTGGTTALSTLSPSVPGGSGNNVGSSLQNITSAINQYVVAPIAAFGLGGYVFNAMGEAVANLSADITDHYTEDNKAIQDQIAIRPKRVTLKGYVGELIYNGPGGGPSTLNSLAQKLVGLTSFLPAITASATQVQSLVSNPGTASFSSVLSTTSNIYGLVQNVLGAFGATKNQQNAYTYFKALMQSATLMSVQTPWEFMTNMAIESIIAIQPENSMWISDFAVTYKEIRIASAASTIGPQSNASSGNGAPASVATTTSSQNPAGGQTNLGNVAGATPNITGFNAASFGATA
jgi:hypothetical protein